MVPIIKLLQPKELDVLNELLDQRVDVCILDRQNGTGVMKESLPNRDHELGWQKLQTLSQLDPQLELGFLAADSKSRRSLETMGGFGNRTTIASRTVSQKTN